MAQALLISEKPQFTAGEHRAWIFTINNWTEKDVEAVKALKFDYLVFGKERGKLRDTPHLQGYVHFARAKDFRYMQRRLRRAWLKCPDGTPEENRTYCTKEGEFEEYGVIPRQGERVDLHEHIDAIMDGEVTCDQICVERPMLFHQYGRTLQRAEDIALRKKFRNWDCTGTWIYGVSGAGKSHRLFEGYNPEKTYLWAKEKWQDGYTGQETVIVNELGRDEIPLRQLLELCDKWPAYVSRRGRQPAPFLAKEFIVTCEHPPEELYALELTGKDSVNQLLRRFKVVHLDQVYEQPQTRA